MKFSHINTREIHLAYQAVSLSVLCRLPYKQALYLSCSLRGVCNKFLLVATANNQMETRVSCFGMVYWVIVVYVLQHLLCFKFTVFYMYMIGLAVLCVEYS
jgi:hypothetical protein